MRFIALAGLAGAGKTEVLARLANAGEQTVDLEDLAAHRGSSFGRIGINRPFPSQAEFNTAVAARFAGLSADRPVWIEDESRHIGQLWLPPEAAAAIATADVVELTAPFHQRVARLAATYGAADPALLIAATQQLRRRFGDRSTDRTVSFFATGRIEEAVAEVLNYFDAGYLRRSAGDTRRRIDVNVVVEALGEPL